MKKIIHLALLGLAALAARPARAADLTLWYTAPGTANMTQGILLGNGRLGCIVPGNVTNESIVLNEDSLWSGNTNSSGGYAEGPTGAFGSYQTFGNLLLNLPGQSGYTGYTRTLDLNNGVATVVYTNAGVAYTRTLFCSATDQVMAVQLTAGATAAYTGSIQLADGHSNTVSSVAGGLMFSGALANGELYEAQLQVTNSGGTLVNGGGTINFTNCNSLTLIIALGTSYSTNWAANYAGPNPHTNVVAQAAAAMAQTFATLQSRHTNDFSALFNRVSLYLGAAPAGRTNLPTDQRITANATYDDDPGMDTLLFAYGRYMMIAASRGGLPMNLQGLWNDNNNPNWSSDYHTDLNDEMMYSGEELVNLPECFTPFVTYLQSQIPVWRYFTTNTSGSINNGGYGGGFGGTNGWATRASQNVWGGQGWDWIEGANAWYCMYVWDHYQFTGDTNYLRNSAYPMLKETCQYWQQNLKALPYATNGVPAGTLVVTNGWSPETGVAREDGVTCDQEFIWDVFTNYQQAAGILSTDAVYAVTVSNLQANLLQPRVGPWGELRPWFYTVDSAAGNGGASSEMEFCGLYPGHQFTPEIWPSMAAAARVKLNTYTDNYEWAYMQHMVRYARLHDWWSAHYWFAQYYHNVQPNLTGYNQVAQMDSCIGASAGVAETLLQSQSGFINLLPALPGAWPAGYVTGLRARGGFTVGITWTNAAASATITPDFTGTCTVHAPNPVTVTSNGVPVTLTTNALGYVQWPAAAAATYALSWVQPPFPAQLPAPMDYAAGVNIGTSLTWLAGGTNYLHNVYFGTSSNAVATATTNSASFKGTLAAAVTNYSVSFLLTNTPYFWRVDEVNGTNTGTGTVWQFTTSGSFMATNPSPAVAATLVATNTLLGWTQGAAGVSNNLYLGTSSNAVATATTASPQYQGSFAANSVLPVTALLTNTTYYWRVDEVAGPAVSPGTVWYFTTTPMQGAGLLWNTGSSTTTARDGSGNWGGPQTNWLHGTGNIAWLDQNVAVFGVNTTTNCTVTVTNAVTPAGLTFAATGGGTYTVTNAPAGSLSVAGNPVLTVSNTGTIGSVLSGTGYPVVAGTGTLNLTAQSTFAGALTVQSGTLVLPLAISGSGSTLGCANINLAPGAVLQCNDGAFGWYGNNNAAGITINITNATCQANGAFGVSYTLTGGSLVGTGYGSGQRLDLGASGGFNVFITSYPSATTSVVNPLTQVLLRTDSGQTSYPFTAGAGTTASGVDLEVQVPINQNGSASGLIKAGSGVLQLDAANGYTGTTTVSGGTLSVKGSLASGSAVTVQSGGTLAGSGTVNGTVTVQAGGTLAAGTNRVVGALTIANTVTLNAGSFTSLRLNKTGGVLTNDTVKGFTTFTQGGTLTVTNITSDGHALTNGDTFYLFPKGSGVYAGTFATNNLPPLAAGLIWNTTQLAVNGSIQVLSQSASLTPSFSPPGGNYIAALGPLTVQVSCPLSGSTIYYTTNGTLPNGSSASGLTPVTVVVPTNASMTIEAYATEGGSTGSLASATYNFPALAGPTWTNLAGGSWAVTGNWLNGTIGQGSSVTADFSRLTLTNNVVVTLNSSPTAGNLIFGDQGGNYNWTVNTGTSGTLTLAGTNAPTVTVNGQTATLGAVIAGTGGVTSAGQGTLALTNANTFTGALTVNGGTLVESVATSGGTGALTINAGAKVSYQVGTYAQAKFSALNIIGGTFSADGASQNSVNGVGRPVLMQGGTLTSTNGLAGPENAGGYGNYLLNGAVLTVSGTNQSVINATTFTTANGASFNVGVTGAGIDLLVQSVFNNGGSPTATLVKNGAGTLALAAANTYAGVTSVSNGTLLVNGSIAGGSTVTVSSGGTLGGTGVIYGAATVQAGGSLAPGNGGIGILTFGNTLSLAGNALLKLSQAANGSTTNDLVIVTNTLTLGGTLTVTNIGTNALVSGDTFKLFQAGTFAGNFSGLTLPALGSGLVWGTNTVATNGTITVNTAPPVVIPPTPTMIQSWTIGSGGLLLGGTGAVGQTCILLAATNLTTPAWTPVATNMADTNSMFWLNDPQATNWPARFYRIVTP